MTPPIDAGRDAGDLRARVVGAVVRRRRLWIALCASLVILVGVRASSSGARGATLEEALAAVAARDGIRVDPSTVSWLGEDEGPLHMRGAVFLGALEGGLDDLYYADVRPGGSSTALDVAWLTNLSRTGSAAEEPPVRVGDHIAYATRVGERYDAIVVMDLRGAPARLMAGWSGLARRQMAITNLQDTGRMRGFGVVRHQLVQPSATVTLAARDGRLEIESDAVSIVIDPARATPIRGEDHVESQEQTQGAPETIPWAVDTVRNISWVGPEPIEWLENRVYAVKDSLTRAYHAVAGADTAEEVAEEVAEELAMPDVDEERIAILTVTDPELGWPPGPLDPIVDSPVVEGEGGWIPVVDDPFVNRYPNAPPAFYQAFLRADPARPYTRIYVTIWDPRQVQMRIQSGVAEPESATGQRGTGMIPREERVLSRLVGAFNGGFQALHGEFGMMASRRVYLPPKPWAATVAVFDDGRIGMGSWPAPSWRGAYYNERLATRQIPEGMVDMRQNLTSVVEDGTYNPWERWYWGAAPRDADDQTLTSRSGLCLTAEGFLAYFWGQGSGPDALGAAMIQTRCVRALHLDMNNPHCGFEFFRPFAPGERPPPLPRRRRPESEYDGRFMRAPRGWRLRARRAVRSMGMPFPRYSGRDARDFFYLTLRPILPGPHLHAEGEMAEGEGVFRTDGLPHAGFPHAFARTFLGEEEARTWIVRIDPRRAVPASIRREDHTRALGYLTASAGLIRQDAGYAIFARRTEVGWDFLAGRPTSDDRVLLTGPLLADLPDAGAAIGIDGDGFLVYAERAGGDALAPAFVLAGVEDPIALPVEARLAFAVGSDHAGVDGFTRRSVQAGTAIAFFAEERPATEVLFRDNTPQPYQTWGYLQDQRVRYFPHREGGENPRFGRPLDGR